MATSAAPFAVSSFTMAGFSRIVTNRKIFPTPTPVPVALAFCDQLARRPHAVLVQPGPRHWSLLTWLVEAADLRGAMVSDAYLAALAIEHGCELVTTDADFSRFPDLLWRHPLGAA